MKIYFVYMVLCSDGSFYIGITNDVQRRVAQHNLGTNRRAYTYTRRPVKLVYASDFYDVDDAIRWEKHVKGWSHAKKQALIESDWPTIQKLARGKWLRHPSTSSG